jgi:subtilase family serine protease
MLDASMPATKRRNRNQSLLRRFQTRLRVEELESRTLLSVYTPVQIRHAYGIDNISLSGKTGDGTGQTIAIIDAFHDSSIQSDIANFSRQFGLPQLDGQNGHGTFYQVDLSNGTPAAPTGWSVEIALDVEWAHAVAPKANIVLVEANSDLQDANTGAPTDLLNAIQFALAPTTTQTLNTPVIYTPNGTTTADKLPTPQTVSMSWGTQELPGETSWDSVFNPQTNPSAAGVTFLAASGDSGAGTIWPSVSPYVVSVGGTTLRLTSSNTISRETGWGYGNWSFYFGGSGGGFSQFESLPSYQQNIPTTTHGFKLTQFNARLNPDVALDADPNTGYYVYSGVDGGWYAVGGTSASTPEWAGLIAIADQGRASPLSSTDTLNALYNIYGTPASYTQDFHQITSGSTGTYYVYDNNGNFIGTIPVTAGPGYNMVTGLGTPVANKLIPDLAAAASSSSGASGAARTGPSSGGSSGGAGAGAKAKKVDIVLGQVSAPTTPVSSTPTGGSTTTGPSATQIALLVANSSGVATAVVVTPASTASTAAVVAVPVVPQAALLTTNAPTPVRTETGGGVNLTVPDNQQGGNQSKADAQPVNQPATGDIPARQEQTPGTTDSMPVLPDDIETGFLDNQDLAGLTQGQEETVQPITAFGSATRLEAAAVVGLVFALAWERRRPALQAEVRERRRLQV